MNPHLLLRLPEHPDQPVHWLTRSPSEGTTLASGYWLSVAEFIERFGHTTIARPGGLTDLLISGLDVTVLVPAPRVTLHTLDIQGRPTPAIRQSLPWRLEEELGDDVENLHIAILHHGDNQAHLAITGKSDMALWQHWLNAAGVVSKRWVPDALMLPATNEQCRQLTIDNLTIYRYGQWQIAACEPGWVSLFLDALGKDFPQLEIVESEQTVSSPLEALAAEAGSTKLNLLQGAWQPASPWRQRLLPWRSVAVMGGIFLALLTVNMTLDIRHLERESASYQQQARDIYQQIFPGERVVRLQSQMQQKLAALQQSDVSSHSMLTTLARITPLLNAFPELTALSMNYDNTRHDLRIQARANNFDLFTRLRERFASEIDDGELTLTIEALEQTGDNVTGQLVISGDLS